MKTASPPRFLPILAVSGLAVSGLAGAVTAVGQTSTRSGDPAQATAQPTANSADAAPVLAAQQGAASADADRRALVLARFTGGEVTVGELEDAIAVQASTERWRLASDPAARQQLLRDMVDYELLVLEAERRGYDQDPVVVHRTGRASVAEMSRVDLWVDPGAVEGDKVRARFEQVAADRVWPRTRRATLLVVASEQEALAQRRRLAGHDRTAFQNAVLELSIDGSSRAQAGQMGFFDERGRRAPGQADFGVPEPIVKATFATEQGKISAPFAYGGGFALVMVTGENRASNPTFESLEPELRGELAEQAMDAAVEALSAQLREASPPVVQEALLGQIRLNTSLEGIPSGVPAAPTDPTAPAVEVEPDGV